MSRDKRLNRTQEVVGSIPISSTNHANNLDAASARIEKRECLVSRLMWREPPHDFSITYNG